MKNDLSSKTNFDTLGDTTIKIKKTHFNDDYVDDPTQDGFTRLIHSPIEVTGKELIKALLYNASNNKVLIEKINEANTKFIENKEKYEQLKPVGFEYAPKSAHEYRKDLSIENDLKQMEYLQQIVSYNPDGTINIIPFQKTFCKNLSKGKIKGVDLLKNVKNMSPYELLSDYNDGDTEESKKNSDRYKLINVFNKYGKANGDTEEGRTIFGYMSGLNGSYISDLVYTGNRKIDFRYEYYCNRHFGNFVSKDRTRIDERFYSSLCGRKDIV